MRPIHERGSGIGFVRVQHDGESYGVVGLAFGGGQVIRVGEVCMGGYRYVVTGREVNVVKGYPSCYVLAGPCKIGVDWEYLR